MPLEQSLVAGMIAKRIEVRIMLRANASLEPPGLRRPMFKQVESALVFSQLGPDARRIVLAD